MTVRRVGSGVNLLFTSDTEDVLAWLAALVNTNRESVERLETPAQLDALLTEWGMSGRRLGTRLELDEVRAVRGRIAQAWDADETAELAELANRLFTDSDARPFVTRHDGLDWHLHFTGSEAPLARRIGAEAAMAFVDLLRAGATDRLRRCEADDCTAVLVDLSRNSSRRFCDTGNCANRTHVAAYRDRRRRSGQAAD